MLGRFRRVEAVLLLAAVLVNISGLVALAAREPDPDAASLERASAPGTAAPTTTTTAAPTTTTAAPTTTTAPSTTTTTAPPPPPTTAPPPPPAAPSAAIAAVGAWSLDPYRGLGVWVDVYDWTNEFTGGKPRVTAESIDSMAASGIQTLFIQSSHNRSAADVIEPERLGALIDRAHRHGISVVAWYLPTMESVDLDLRRLRAAAALPVDGLGVDIESRAVADHAERNRRLLDLSARLNHVMGSRAVAAITPSAVHLEVVNPGFWPNFPWAELTSYYEAFQPMAYWTIRRGEYRNGERYIGENIDRIRNNTGRADLPIHPIGGIADGATVADLEGMIRASVARGALGGSLYDWATSNPDQWRALQPFKR